MRPIIHALNSAGRSDLRHGSDGRSARHLRQIRARQRTRCAADAYVPPDSPAAVLRNSDTLSVIRFMGEHTVEVPLWDETGLMYSTPKELAEALGPLGLTAELIADLVTWARDWQTRSGQPEHDAQAARLVRRLSAELGHGIQIVYQP